MTVIAVYSAKGGVGKTSISVNLAWASAQAARQMTLLWDLDPQWSASFVMGHEPESKATARGIYDGDIDPAERVLWTGIDNLDLLPGDSSMRGLDGYFAGLGRKKRVSKIAKGLSKNYARIIIDCPPGLSETSDQIIQSADLIIVPVIPSPLSSRALKDVQAHLLERHGGHVPILPVYSMVDRRRTMHRDALVANPKWPVIPMASVVERMGSEGAPVGAYAPSAPVTQAFSALWKGVERKIAKL